MKGWIKLHRKFTDWEWFTDINTSHLFLYLLLNSNHADKKWRGISVNRGQILTGRIKLSTETGLSQQQIRTALKKLTSTGEIVTGSTSKYTIITICNYNEYQPIDNKEQPANHQQTTTPATNEQPTGNQQVTTNKNVKNYKNEKNDKEEKVKSISLACPHQKIIEEYNKILPGEFSKVQSKLWKGTRKTALATRWREDSERQSVGWWSKYFQSVIACPFLMGENDRGWVPNLEWLLKAGNMTKVLEGNYVKKDITPKTLITPQRMTPRQQYMHDLGKTLTAIKESENGSVNTRNGQDGIGQISSSLS